MNTEPLYKVVFEGRSTQDVSMDKAIKAMARLLRKTPDGVAKFFNDRPTILKKGLTKAQALNYLQVLQAAGLSCHITTDPVRPENSGETGHCCPKCGYCLDHGPANGMRPEECPACGIVLKKFKPGEEPPPPSDDANDDLMNPANGQHENADKQETGKGSSTEYVFPAPGCLVSIASLSFLLPESLALDGPPDRLPAATFGQRVWAAVGTFFHMMFLYVFMQIPVGVVAGVVLLATETSLTRDLAVQLRGVAGLLAMVSAIIVLPSIWRGHTFGQRAMGILLVPTSGRDDDEPSGPAMLLRRLSFGTRSASAVAGLMRPWNKALIPLAAALALHFAVAVPGTAFLAMVGSFGSGSGVSARSDRVTPAKVFTAAGHAKDRNTLMQIHAALTSYMIEYGMGSESLTPESFSEILDRSMPAGMAQRLGSALDNGELRLEGTLSDYRIGLLRNKKWLVLYTEGEIRQFDSF
jgi:hypothetical protein